MFSCVAVRKGHFITMPFGYDLFQSYNYKMVNYEQDSSLYDLFQLSLTNDNLFMIGTSVDTGFEWQAVNECKEKLDKNLHVVERRGKIYFNVDWDNLIKVQEMRSIGNIFIVGSVLKLEFNRTYKGLHLKLCKNAARNLKLEKALNVWKNVTQFPGKMYLTFIEKVEAMRNKKNVECVKSNNSKIRKRGQNPANACNEVLRFRVTCERTGIHIFKSSDVAKVIGEELQNKYKWIVDLSLYHLEIICKIVRNEMLTQLRITHESKHHRNIIHFGPTTLRATICYNLLRLAKPNPGDIIIDPMCGSGSIPIEGGLVYENSFILCGDNHSEAVLRSKANIEISCSKSKVDLTQWDVCYLPLLNNSIDIVVTDVPFAKRCGNISDNRVLCTKFLLQLGRVVRRNTGRLVLLIHDKRSFKRSLKAVADLFKVTKMLGVDIGGLAAIVYVLKRTCIEYK